MRFLLLAVADFALVVDPFFCVELARVGVLVALERVVVDVFPRLDEPLDFDLADAVPRPVEDVAPLDRVDFPLGLREVFARSDAFDALLLRLLERLVFFAWVVLATEHPRFKNFGFIGPLADASGQSFPARVPNNGDDPPLPPAHSVA